MTAPSPIRRNAPRFGSADRLVPQARLAGPMPWVIAIMIALTVIAASAGLALRNLSDNAQAEIAGGLTVQIVEGAPAERERQAESGRAARTRGSGRIARSREESTSCSRPGSASRGGRG